MKNKRFWQETFEKEQNPKITNSVTQNLRKNKPKTSGRSLVLMCGQIGDSFVLSNNNHEHALCGGDLN